VNPLRTVGGRLAVALLVVVAGALGIVYLIVVPSYRHSLVDSRINDLRRTLSGVAAQSRNAPGEVFPSQAWVEDEAVPVASGARVVVFSAVPLLEPIADSNNGTSLDVESDPLPRRALAQRGIVSGTVTRRGVTYAEAAESVGRGGPVVLRMPRQLKRRLQIDALRHQQDAGGAGLD